MTSQFGKVRGERTETGGQLGRGDDGRIQLPRLRIHPPRRRAGVRFLQIRHNRKVQAQQRLDLTRLRTQGIKRKRGQPEPEVL